MDIINRISMEFKFSIEFLSVLLSLIKRINNFNDNYLCVLWGKQAKIQEKRIVSYAKKHGIALHRDLNYIERWWGSFQQQETNGIATYNFVVGCYDYGHKNLCILGREVERFD